MSAETGPAPRIVVDGANVVGARPTGWWRDRPGAAARLVEEIGEAVAAGRLPAGLVVVLEGQARRGVAEGVHGDVAVVHAPGEGDDAIEALARETPGCVVVTADRALRARAVAAGATVVGPRWLLDRLA